MKVVHLYVYRMDLNQWQASSALYSDARQVRKFYECIRACAPDASDVVLTEVKDGFRIEVYL